MTDNYDPTSRIWQVTPDLLGVLDKEGVFMKTNPAWFTTLGRTPEDIETKLFFEFLHPDDMAITAKAFVDVQHGRPVLDLINRYRHADGTYRWLSWNAVPVEDLYYCSARDVTRAHDDRTALALRDKEAKLREQFISILGHDLRNPLAGAACAVENLRMREGLSSDGELMATSATQSLRRMSHLIDDVLDFARARLGGDIGIDSRPGTRLEPVLRRTVDEIALAHPEVTIEQMYEFSDPVTCDPERVAQLVSNLLGNAVFHGEPGGTVLIHAQDVGADVAVAVSNKGGKIPAAVKALLFEPFTRAEPGSSQNGLGLGLFIAKQIAKGHGGDIEVESSGTETTFTFKMPRGMRLVDTISDPIHHLRTA
ncbi:PAS domain-containing sensor histidine kinase [Jannaschia aquimarina]|nr:PAS domain-containing sensor histidine kinase [Jannaschia aquimarina]